MNFKFHLLFSSSMPIDLSSSNANHTFLAQILEPTLFPNLSPMIEKSLPIAFVFVLIGFQKGKEKVNEEVIVILFVDPTEAPIIDSKKKKQNKFEWELNRVYQNPWVTRF
jgi:hypothetical protein